MPHDRLHRLLPLLSLSTRPTSQTAEGTAYDLDELLAEAEALLAEAVPPDDDGAARVAFEERLDQVRLRLRTLWAREALLDSEEDLLVDALRALGDVLARADAVDVSRASSGSSTQPAEDSGSSTQPPVGSGSSTQPPDGGGAVDRNLMPPTPEDTGVLVGQKRPRGLVFDAYDDPETALTNWNRMAPTLSQADREHAREMIHTFVQDQAEASIVVVDCETQTLASDRVPVSSMLPSVSVALLLPVSSLSTSNAMRIIAWPSDIPRGCAYEFLNAALDHATRIVAHYGSRFDLPLLARGDEARLARWQAKLHDPLLLLRGIGERGLGLGALLQLNSLGGKTGSGSDAPALFRQGKFQELEDYCANDVDQLAALVLKPEIRVPSGQTTNIVSLRPAAAAPAAPATATQELAQQSEEWFQARKDKITASAAAGLLSLSPFSTRQSSFERLVLNARSAPTAAMQRGIDEEGRIADMYARAFPQAVMQPTGLWTHPEHAWLVASPDRLLGEQGLLEVKSFYKLAKPGPHVLIQVLIQLECTSRRFCDVIQYDGTRVRVDRVERDRELQEDLIELLRPVYEAANAARAGGSRMAPSLNMNDWEVLRDGLRGLYVRRLV